MSSSIRQARSKWAEEEEWYKPGPSIQEFHDSQAKVRVLIGGRGSGKTTGVAVDVLRHCINDAGARVLCLRKTQVANDDTSVVTFNQAYEKTGFRVTDEDISLFRKWDGGLTVRIPSRDAVDAYNKFVSELPRTKAQIRAWIANEGDRLCSYIVFRGLKDEEKSQGQLRGFECSMMVMIEADLLEESDVDLGIGCLRWKDAYGEYFDHYSLILDTNPPNPRHWIAEMEKKKIKENDNNYQFWHISTYENAHNMRPGYVEDLEGQYRNKPAHRRRYILGEYADLFDGSPVFFAFKEDRHAREDIPWPQGAYLVRSWDFGSTHANVFSAYFKVDFDIGGKIVPVEYWWDLFEFFNEMSDTERQCRSMLDITEREFPFWNDRSICSGVMDFCDPAGAAKTDKGSSVEVLMKNAIFPRWQTRVRSLDTTIAIYNRLLETKDPEGRWVYKIDKKYCPRLFSASLGEYRYPFKGEAGYNTGEPIKGPKANGADHIADASRYGKLNCLRLMQRMMDESLKPKTGILADNRRKINPKKRWY